MTEAKKLITDHHIKYFLTTLFPNDADFDAQATAIQEAVDKGYAEFITKMDAAEEAGSDQDILDLKIQRVKFGAQILEDFTKLNEYLQEVLKETSSATTRIELYFALSKYALSKKDYSLYSTYIETLTPLVSKDGDWDSRNRFNIYNAINYLLSHNFTEASPLMLNSIQTFASTDILNIDSAMILATYLSIIRCPRKDLVSKVVESPEIIQTLLANQVERDFLDHIYNCRYTPFSHLLPAVQDRLLRSPFLASLAPNYLKEARLVAYRQFLQSFQYVKIDAFAQSFGVSADFIEKDVANLISAGRLEARINLVDNIIEMSHTKNKMSQFEQVLVTADVVVNKLNKFTQQAKAL